MNRLFNVVIIKCCDSENPHSGNLTNIFICVVATQESQDLIKYRFLEIEIASALVEIGDWISNHIFLDIAGHNVLTIVLQM